MLTQRVVAASILYPFGNRSGSEAVLYAGALTETPYVVAICSNQQIEPPVGSAYTNWSDDSVQREAAARRHIRDLETTVSALQHANEAARDRERSAAAQLKVLEGTIDDLRRVNAEGAQREAAAADQLRAYESHLAVLLARESDRN